MLHLRDTAFAIAAVFLTCGVASPAPAKDVSDAAIEARCKQYHRDGCSEAMGRWLPRFAYDGDWRPRATRKVKRDAFAYENERPPLSGAFLQRIGPADGTFFVHDEAGPPKGRAVYDPVHRIAFYAHGCCSWKEAVLIADAPAPPTHVKTSDLSNLSTVRGIRLGQSEARVFAMNGARAFNPVRGHPGVMRLSYTTLPEPDSPGSSSCDQVQNYFFRAKRLISIQFENEC